MSRGFFAVSYAICQLPGLSRLDQMVLARIASFGVCFESAETTAEFLNASKASVQKCKQKLENRGYIYCIENNGRGKKYLTRVDLRTREMSKKDLAILDNIKNRVLKNNGSFFVPEKFMNSSVAEEAAKDDKAFENNNRTMTPVAPKIKSASGASERSDRGYNAWAKKNKDLIPVLDASMNYLRRNKIPVVNTKALRNSLVKVADLYRDEQYEGSHVDVLLSYIEYLESPAYLYQLDHSKYCPRVLTQSDLYSKFEAIRNFKWDTRRHYDPSKVLTN